MNIIDKIYDKIEIDPEDQEVAVMLNFNTQPMALNMAGCVMMLYLSIRLTRDNVIIGLFDLMDNPYAGRVWTGSIFEAVSEFNSIMDKILPPEFRSVWPTSQYYNILSAIKNAEVH